MYVDSHLYVQMHITKAATMLVHESILDLHLKFQALWDIFVT